jgi:hypothetical protein
VIEALRALHGIDLSRAMGRHMTDEERAAAAEDFHAMYGTEQSLPPRMPIEEVRGAEVAPPLSGAMTMTNETTTKCGGCDGKIVNVDGLGVGTCASCGGTCTTRRILFSESLRYVGTQWSDRTDMEGARYFDLDVANQQGFFRRHGWFDPKTRLILQDG